MLKHSIKGSILAAGVMTAHIQPVAASDDFVKALGAAALLGAIANQSSSGSSNQTASTQRAYDPQREERREIQAALNYFGFPAGTPDGIFGRKTRAAVSTLQSELGFEVTGELTTTQKEFLLEAHRKADLGGEATAELVTTLPDGRRGLLRQFHKEETGLDVVELASVTEAQAVELEALREDYEDVQQQLALLQAIEQHQMRRPQTPARDATLAVVRQSTGEFEAQLVTLEEQAVRDYKTPIRPANANLGITALRASETFHRVPYYIPGTREIGEMWVEPKVTETGELMYNFNFMDPAAEYAVTRESIAMASAQIGQISDGFEKVSDWTVTAQDNGVRKRFAKQAICFPLENCAEKRVGISSTEVVFLIYEDGSTAGQVKRNKGTFSTGFNFSVESGLLLAGYLRYMVDIGEQEFMTGSMTNEDLDNLFD